MQGTKISNRIYGGNCVWLLLHLGLPCWAGNAVLSLSAYRALGQADLRQNAVNMVGPSSLNSPQGVAVDAAGHLYVSDALNNRVLGWANETSLQNGEPAALVLGQSNFRHTIPNGLGPKGLTIPGGLAVDPITGNLYVADLGNNRVVRFPHPFVSGSGTSPDAVYGQPDFTKRGPNTGGISNKTMSGPRGVACDSQGNLWVADTGNNRVLRFSAAVLNATDPAADLILGQPNATSAKPNRGSTVSGTGFASPWGLAFDPKGDLYVSDFLNARVLEFQVPINSASTAVLVLGQAIFTTRGLPAAPNASSMAGPAGVAVDGLGELFVSIPNDNRILVFAPAARSGDLATRLFGQPDFTTNTVNTGTFPEASANSLASAAGIAVDAQGDLLVADGGNNRVLWFGPHSITASVVLGQAGFTGNGQNQIKPGSVNAAYKIAIDYSQSPFALYVSDTNNNRVLIWKDAAHFHSGDPADLVIGQPDLVTAIANVDGGAKQTASATGLFAPRGITVDVNGDVFVADSGNNRVLHYPRPVSQSGRIMPDAVLGQPDFTTSTISAVSASSFVSPSGLALGPNGDLFVADTGNNRVVEFATGATTGAAAIRVYGQADFTTAVAPVEVSAETLTAPQGLAVDKSSNLYVADLGANRVVVYPDTSDAPQSGLPASLVLGQKDFSHGSAGSGPSGLRTPLDVALDSRGNIFVADTTNNRVAVFPSLANLLTAPGPPYQAYLAIGQEKLTGTAPNWDTPDGLATPEGLIGPVGLLLDRQDTLFVGDSGNNRVVQFLKQVSIVNAATSQASAPVGQGAWCILSGTGLAAKSAKAGSAALPTTLANRELVVNDNLPVPLSSVSSTQIKLILPAKTPVGVQRIAARTADTGEPLAGGPIAVAEYAPGLYTTNHQGTGQAMAINQDGTPNGASHPAPRGSTVRLFGTGQGPITTPVPDGQPAPSAPDNTVAKPTSDGNACLAHHSYVCVALGGSNGGAAFADVTYSGLAPRQVGTWELDIVIPKSGLEGSTVGVRAAIGGVNFSNEVSLAIK